MSQNVEDNRKKWPGATSDFTVADKPVDTKKVWEIPSDYEKGGEYGKVLSYTYRGGQTVEIDQTKDGERIRVIHPSGSYVDLQHDGQVIYRSNNHNFEVVVGDKNLRVKGALHIHVSGDANIKVEGNATTEVGGNWDTKVGGNWNVKVGGDYNLTTGGNINFNK